MKVLAKIKIRKIVWLVLIVAGIFALVNCQLSLVQVRATSLPVMVSTNNLNFGTVFPGEKRQGSFNVYYLDDSGLEVDYKIVQKIKPLPDSIPPAGYIGTMRDYCQENGQDFSRCYHNLCNYLTKISQENEGDTETSAKINADDKVDSWVVSFITPAILGTVAQAHDGGVVTENGDYGCDLSVEIKEDDSIKETQGKTEAVGSGGNLFIATLSSAGGGETDKIKANSQPQVLGVSAEPILVINKTVGQAFANPGDTVVYKIRLENSGDLTAYNIFVSDELPTGFTFVDQTFFKTWSAGNLSPGEVWQKEYEVQIDKNISAGSYANIASAIADNHPRISQLKELEVKEIKVLGMELTPTGFSLKEFLIIIIIIIGLLGGDFLIKRRYLI